MKFRFCRRIAFAALLLIFASTAVIAAQATIPDFTFAHISDAHNMPGSAKTISELKDLHPILLKPYNVTSLPISFIIDTGDTTEFGPTGGAWNTYLSFFKDITIPHYNTVGNHDETWRALDYEVRQLYGSLPYSFDKNGCHFVMLNTAGLQDPLPNIGPEQLTWLANDLKKAGTETPVFLAFHHPLMVTEFASKYEVERLMDVIRPYNVVLMLDGHGHTAEHKVFEGIDRMEGGSTFTGSGAGTGGYQVVCIKDGILHAAYKEFGNPDATRAMLEKPLAPPAKRYPAITIDSPAAGATFKDQLPVKANVALGKGEVASAFVEIDGANKTDLADSNGSYAASVPLTDLATGAHYIKVTFVAPDKAEYCHSSFFYVDSVRPKVLWRVQTGVGSKTTPTLSDKMIYIGGYDGTVRAYARKTGKFGWKYETGGPIAGQILLLGDKVYAGSCDKYLYCLDAATGKFVWKFQADDPIFSCPVTDGTSIYFGCGTGAFYSVDAKTGAQNWKNTDATYNIESKAFLANGKVYYGAWDQYVYCLNTADGKLAWKCKGQGSAEGGAARYYAPGDAGPVLCAGMVFAPDRKFRCSLILDATGKQATFLNSVVSATASADGKSVYLRDLSSKVRKVDAGGNVIWTADVPTDDRPPLPCEAGDVVYVCSRRGTVSALTATDGKLLWQYHATPSLAVLAGIGGTRDTAYVMGTDGSLTALVDPTPGVVK